jgi:lipopolysaccharide export system protein LptC
MSDIAARVLSERRHWAAPGSNHDDVVRWARAGLPVTIGVLTAFLVVAPLMTGGDVSFVLDKNRVEVARERMHLQSALYRGEDDKGQPFSLGAGSAIQKSSSEPIVQLNQLAAQISLTDGPASLQADHGRYDMDRQQVAIDTPVQFTAANGYRLNASSATMDLKTKKLKSEGPVQGTVPQGNFSASQMSADLENHVVTLNGNARLRIVPRRTK